MAAILAPSKHVLWIACQSPGVHVLCGWCSVLRVRASTAVCAPCLLGWRHLPLSCLQVVSGLPRLLTGSILAHECMHAWLRMSGFSGHRQLAPQVEEGLCQLMALLWLEAQQSQVRCDSVVMHHNRGGSMLLVSMQAAVGCCPCTDVR